MKKCILALLVFCACHTVVSMDSSDKLESIRLILLSCGDPDGPTQEEELRAFAIAHDISNAEMSSMLIELAGPGLAAHAEPLQRELVDGVLWGLGCFGGAKEKEFVRNVMRTSRDSHLQKAAVRVGIRMMPEGWEEWVREVVSDKRYDEMVRFDAYEEAFRRRKNKEACRRSLVESHSLPSHRMKESVCWLQKAQQIRGEICHCENRVFSRGLANPCFPQGRLPCYPMVRAQ